MSQPHDRSYANCLPAKNDEGDMCTTRRPPDYSTLNQNSSDSTMPFILGESHCMTDFSFPVYATIAIFAISSWIDINGVFVELPLLVESLPEGWKLPSYLTVVIQVANIGPLLYTAAMCLDSRVKEWPVIYFILLVGTGSCLCLSFTWHWTTWINSSEHSTWLLSLTCCLALVDCTSSVVYLPYMSNFVPNYMTAFYIGEGLGGLIPAVIGLAQGLGADPQCINTTDVSGNFSLEPVYPPPAFSVDTFFLILFALISLSCIAFTFLHFLPFFNKAKVSHTVYNVYPAVENSVEDDQFVKGKTFVCLLTLVCLANFLTNGILPSMQSYSSLPYSNKVYTLSIRLSALSNPIACLIALFVPLRGLLFLIWCSMAAYVLSAYQIYLAFASPSPPLQEVEIGGWLVVTSAVLIIGLLSFVKVQAACLFRIKGHRALLWCGIVTQIGSSIGALTAFLVVNVFNMLTSSWPCS